MAGEKRMRRPKAIMRRTAGLCALCFLFSACAQQSRQPDPRDDDYPHIRYPAHAVSEHEEGTASVRVRIRRDGTLESAKLLKSSGFEDLDDEAVAVFYRIRKFPAVADDVSPDVKVFQRDMPITFSLK